MTFFLVLLLFCMIVLAVDLAFSFYYIRKKIIYPFRLSYSEVRQREIQNGFAEAVYLYESIWKRKPFFVDNGDVRIEGEILSVDKSDEKYIAIISHGRSVNRFASLKYAQVFLDEGYTVFIYDQRYFGSSTGKNCTLSLQEKYDLSYIIDYVRNIYGQDVKIALQGESMGGATVLSTLELRNVDYAIVDCPFADMKTHVEEWIKNTLHLPVVPLYQVCILVAKIFYSYNFNEVNPISIVSKTKVPILFMHGKEDVQIPFSHSERMYNKRLNNLSELYIFPNASHAQSFQKNKKEYESIMKNYIKKM